MARSRKKPQNVWFVLPINRSGKFEAFIEGFEF